MASDAAREDEVEMLKAMYCGDGEFIVDPFDPFSFEIRLSDGSVGMVLQVTLPDGYPICRPEMRISSDELSRHDVGDLMQGLSAVMDESAEGEPVMCAVIDWLQEHGLARVAAAAEQARLRTASSQPGPQADARKDLVQGSQCVMWAERGDLFEVGPEWALCHCVSKDFEMSAGIAAEFKRRFGGVDELKKQDVDVGQVAVLEKKGRLLYYLVTKKGYRGKSTMESMESSLRAMKQHVTENSVKKLALPQIGCGLDQLSWGAVRGLILQVFDEVDIELLVRSR